ncbi:zinc ribbon domain-containing protein, partial [Streptomyces sp. IBSBF 2953]|nr:zinc ribbon domain-containing protein [Streptomyces hayashii]
MSQMPRQAALPTCPSCAEPLDAGDRFCGACGYDLSAVPSLPDDHPTLTMNGSAPPAPAQGTTHGTGTVGAGAPGANGAGVPGAGVPIPGAGVPVPDAGIPVPDAGGAVGVPGAPLPPPAAA